MSEPREVRSVVDAAEQAAAASDYPSAEQLLREAAVLQEASLGPLHPDLAHTLNNLGVVCEITEKPVDAEQYFRRACAIATAVLQPDHPFVATSRQNLEDFCEARGTAVDWPTPPAPIAEDRSWSRPLAIGALIAGALLLTLTGAATWFRWNDEVDVSRASPSVSPPVSPATTIDTTSTPPTGREAREAPSLPPASAENRVTEASVQRPPIVASAQLCSDLSTGGPAGSSSDWQCVPPNLPVGPGLLFFTRASSPRLI